MGKDQTYGFVIFIVSVIVALVYLAAFFAPFIGLPSWLQFWAVAIPVLLFVLLVLVIGAWIGWTMLTTPPPAPLETSTEPAAAESKPEETKPPTT
ncbi:MAG TPA: hypothetical protein VLV31_02915 [Candidatus Acidoferrales bacterium]|nr:hypothetical protein [Candidatus Acidoferrales bacterium]